MGLVLSDAVSLGHYEGQAWSVQSTIFGLWQRRNRAEALQTLRSKPQTECRWCRGGRWSACLWRFLGPWGYLKATFTGSHSSVFGQVATPHTIIKVNIIVSNICTEDAGQENLKTKNHLTSPFVTYHQLKSQRGLHSFLLADSSLKCTYPFALFATSIAYIFAQLLVVVTYFTNHSSLTVPSLVV